MQMMVCGASKGFVSRMVQVVRWLKYLCLSSEMLFTFPGIYQSVQHVCLQRLKSK